MITKVRRAVSRVFIHCSASDNPAHDDVSVIEKWHIERGFKKVGYHFFITKEGEIQDGRPLAEIPAAQEGYNSGSIAICLHGLSKDKFTPAQFTSLNYLADEIQEIYPTATFHGHCEVSKKACPVFNYRKVLGLDNKGNRRKDI